MPYVSHNYRCMPRSRTKSLTEAFMFIAFSGVAIFVTLIILGFMCGGLASAAPGINTQINYQGKMTTSAGVQVTNGNWNFRFRIYDASSGGTLLWTERWTSTTTQATTVNGVFSVALGSLGQADNLADVDWNSNSLYLQIDLDADGNGTWEESFSTRKRFSASSYAFNADAVDGLSATSTAAIANYLIALDANKTLNLYDGGVSSTRATTTELYVTDRLAVATTTPWDGYELAVNGDAIITGDTSILGSATTSGTFSQGFGGGWGNETRYVSVEQIELGGGLETLAGIKFHSPGSVFGADYLGGIVDGLYVFSDGNDPQILLIDSDALNAASITYNRSAARLDFASSGGITFDGQVTFTGSATTTLQGNLSVAGVLYDSSGDHGAAGEVLSSTGSGIDWVPAGGAGASQWQYTFDGVLTPTSTTAGVFVNASSTFNSTLRVNNGLYIATSTSLAGSVFAVQGDIYVEGGKSTEFVDFTGYVKSNQLVISPLGGEALYAGLYGYATSTEFTQSSTSIGVLGQGQAVGIGGIGGQFGVLGVGQQSGGYFLCTDPDCYAISVFGDAVIAGGLVTVGDVTSTQKIYGLGGARFDIDDTQFGNFENGATSTTIPYLETKVLSLSNLGVSGSGGSLGALSGTICFDFLGTCTSTGVAIENTLLVAEKNNSDTDPSIGLYNFDGSNSATLTYVTSTDELHVENVSLVQFNSPLLIASTTNYLVFTQTGADNGAIQYVESGDVMQFINSATYSFSDKISVSNPAATSTFAGDVEIADGRTLQVSNIMAYSPLTVSTDLIVTGNATSTHFAASEICLNGDCKTAWPLGGGGSSDWQYTFDAVLTPTSTNSGLFVNASSTYNSTLRVNGALSALGGGSFSSLFTANDFRASTLNASSTRVGTLTAYGNVVFGGDVAVTGLTSFGTYPTGPGLTPTTSTQLVDKAYVDAAVSSGSRFVGNVRAATTASLPANTYNNGTLGAGATLTGTSNGALTAQDGITLTTSDRILVKNESSQANNGCYSVTQVGDGSNPYILTRCTDYDVQAEISTGTFFTILEGTTQSLQQWSMNNNATITVGTTSITFGQLSASAVQFAQVGDNLQNVTAVPFKFTNGVFASSTSLFTGMINTGLGVFSDLRPAVLNASSTNVGTLNAYGLATFADARATTLNASTTAFGTTTLFGALTNTTGLSTLSDLRASILNATTTAIGTLTVYTGSTFNGLTSISDLRAPMLNSTTTNIGTLRVYTGSTLSGLTTAADLRVTTLNATTTAVGTLTAYSGGSLTGLFTATDFRPSMLNASTTNIGTLTAYGNSYLAVSSGSVGIGDASPAALLTVGSGDLFRVDTSGNLIRVRNVAYSWPSSQGSSGQVLSNDGSGNLSWATVSSGGGGWTDGGQYIALTNNTDQVAIGSTSGTSAKLTVSSSTLDTVIAIKSTNVTGKFNSRLDFLNSSTTDLFTTVPSGFSLMNINDGTVDGLGYMSMRVGSLIGEDLMVWDHEGCGLGCGLARIGIQTTAPVGMVDIKRDESNETLPNLVLNSDSSTGEANMYFAQNGTLRSYIRYEDTGDSMQLGSNYGDMQFLTGTGGFGFERLSISEAGVTVFNELGVDADFRIESNDNQYMLFMDAGNNRIGIATSTPGGYYGETFTVNGPSYFHGTSATVATFNRETNDGTVISIRQAGSEEGTISVSGTTVSYNAFTGSHYAWTDDVIDMGMLVSWTGNNRRLHDDPNSEILYGITPTAQRNDPRVLGGYLSILNPSEPTGKENPHLVMAAGNGDVWVIDTGENLVEGDYLISSGVTGHAQKDDGADDVSNIIARVAEPVDWSTVSDTVNGIKRKKISVLFGNFTRDNRPLVVEDSNNSGDDSSLVVIDNPQSDIETLVVRQAANFYGTIYVIGEAGFEHKVTFHDDIEVKGKVYVSKDQAGTATITPSLLTVDVTFETEYKTTPRITITPRSNPQGFYWVTNESPTGFTINLSTPLIEDLGFNWIALANGEEDVIPEEPIIENPPVEEGTPPVTEGSGDESGSGSEPEPPTNPVVEEDPAPEPPAEDPAPDPGIVSSGDEEPIPAS